VSDTPYKCELGADVVVGRCAMEDDVAGDYILLRGEVESTGEDIGEQVVGNHVSLVLMALVSEQHVPEEKGLLVLSGCKCTHSGRGGRSQKNLIHSRSTTASCWAWLEL
jgi:hypothetical protein